MNSGAGRRAPLYCRNKDVTYLNETPGRVLLPPPPKKKAVLRVARGAKFPLVHLPSNDFSVNQKRKGEASHAHHKHSASWQTKLGALRPDKNPNSSSVSSQQALTAKLCSLCVSSLASGRTLQGSLLRSGWSGGTCCVDISSYTALRTSELKSPHTCGARIHGVAWRICLYVWA